MVSEQSLSKLLGMDVGADERVQNRCIESAANIVRDYTGRMILPDELNGIVMEVAALLYQRRMSCCELETGKTMRVLPRDIVHQLDVWRLPASND